MSATKKLHTMMHQHSKSQRTKVEIEAILLQKLHQLSEAAYERRLISSYGNGASPDSGKVWVIQIDGKDKEFTTLEEAKLELEEMLNSKDSD